MGRFSKYIAIMRFIPVVDHNVIIVNVRKNRFILILVAS